MLSLDKREGNRQMSVKKKTDTAAHVEVLREMIRVDRRALQRWEDGSARTCGGLTDEMVGAAKVMLGQRIAALEAAVAALEAPAVMAASVEAMACPRCGWAGEALPDVCDFRCERGGTCRRPVCTGAKEIRKK